MKKEKIFAISATALALAGSLGGVTALAEGTSTTGTTDPTELGTNVKYQVDQTYEWSIHPEIDFGANKDVNKDVVSKNEKNTVSVTKSVLAEGNKLHIQVKGSGTDDAFTINNGKSEVLSYAINDGTADLAVDGTVLDVAAGANVGSKDLKFTLRTANRASEIAGSYTGTVTYTASVVSQ